MYLTYPVALAGLCAVTVGGLAVAFWTGHGSWAWAVFPVVAVLAGAFLYRYSQRPGPVPRARPPPAPVDDEPFEDPVEEADRAASDPIFAASDPATEGVQGPGSIGPPVPEGVPPGAPGLDEPSP
jgi:hypothetical protein